VLNDFDVNIKTGLLQSNPLVLHRVFVHRNEQNALVRDSTSKVPRVPIFGSEHNGQRRVRGCRPVLEVHNQGRLVYSTLTGRGVPDFFFEGEDEVVNFQVTDGSSSGVSLVGDVVVTCYHVELRVDAMPGLEDGGYREDNIDKEIIWRYSCHTGFVQPGLIRMVRSELDIREDKELGGGKSVPQDIVVDMVFSDGALTAEEYSYDVGLFSDNERCMEDCSALHTVDADPKKVYPKSEIPKDRNL